MITNTLILFFFSIIILIKKLIRLNQILISKFQSNPLENFHADFDFNFSIGLWLKISSATRVPTEDFWQPDANLVNFLQLDSGRKIFDRSWLKFFYQTLIQNFSVGSRLWLKTWSGSIEPWLNIFAACSKPQLNGIRLAPFPPRMRQPKRAPLDHPFS